MPPRAKEREGHNQECVFSKGAVEDFPTRLSQILQASAASGTLSDNSVLWSPNSAGPAPLCGQCFWGESISKLPLFVNFFCFVVASLCSV